MNTSPPDGLVETWLPTIRRISGGTAHHQAVHRAHRVVGAVRAAAANVRPASGALLADYLALLGSGRCSDALALCIREVARIPEEILAAAPSAPPSLADARRAAMGCRGDLEAMAADGTDVTRWSTIDVPVLLMEGADTWAPLPSAPRVVLGVSRTSPPARRHI